ncbi:helix-turn-helix transcriptional regulator [Serratia marcescens]|uniref:helix-turn-helix transcriptional regulator n=1 Tax=Serratia marcescens TaxID=615 RepID=UPI00165333CF|nr:LuxR C-terminal-related transcriptional regulator [Serratia marcescens]
MRTCSFFYIGDDSFCKISVEELFHQTLDSQHSERSIFFIECNKFRSLSDLRHRLSLIKKSHPAASVLFITRRLAFLPMKPRFSIDINSSVRYWRKQLKRFLLSESNIDEVIAVCELSHFLPRVSPSAHVVATMLATGCTIDEISVRLGITNKAVYAHATKIRYKLRMFSLVQLCFYLENEFHAGNSILR